MLEEVNMLRAASSKPPLTQEQFYRGLSDWIESRTTQLTRDFLVGYDPGTHYLGAINMTVGPQK